MPSSKKIAKKIKKKIGPMGLIIVVLFLAIGVGLGFFINSKTTIKEERKTNISLVGENILNLKVGEEYTEEGFNFIIDGVNYNDNVKVDGKVLSEAGEYIIKYSLEYNSKTYTLTRIVNVGE